MDQEQKERFYKFMQSWLESEFLRHAWMPEVEFGVKQVIGVRETSKWNGYCETCYHEWTEVEIKYLDNEGTLRTHNYSGSMAELLGFDD